MKTQRIGSKALALAMVLAGGPLTAHGQDRVSIDGSFMERYEISIARFADFALATGRTTAAELDGGGHEWGNGWERRAGWNVHRPFGVPPQSLQWPAVHVNWYEARDFCAWAGGRLPSRVEWTRAAYTEQGEGVRSGFVKGQTYPYPTGRSEDGANTNASDP